MIEEDISLRESISEMLLSSEYTLVTADNGRTGIERAIKDKPDLILCDMEMPNLNGYGIMNILSRHPVTKLTPFVFLTGRKGLENLGKGMGSGAADYLLKPFSKIELLNTLELSLRESQRVKQKEIFENTASGGLLKQISQEYTSWILAGREIKKFGRKHVLYRENQKPAAVYNVISGILKECRMNESGKELITNMYAGGDFIGYRAILENVNYSESVHVIEDAELMVIPREDFMELVDTDMIVAKKFLWLLSCDVHKMEEKLITMAYNSLRKKVALGIIEVADKFKNQVKGKPVIPLSRDDLAHVVGSAPESMIRTLKEFKREKLIDVEAGHIIVLNDQKIRNLMI